MLITVKLSFTLLVAEYNCNLSKILHWQTTGHKVYKAKIALSRPSDQPPPSIGPRPALLRTLHLGDYPDFSSLIGAHEQSPSLVESETCWPETIFVPNVGNYLPALADVDIAHDVDDCGLAVRLSDRESTGEVDLGKFVARRTVAIPK